MQLNASPHLAKAALKVLVPFATNNLCQSSFSTFLHLKSKTFQSPNLSEPDEDMRVATSNKELHCSMIVEKTTKEPCLIVGVLYCKFIVLLYRCKLCQYQLLFDFRIGVRENSTKAQGVRAGRKVKNHQCRGCELVCEVASTILRDPFKIDCPINFSSCSGGSKRCTRTVVSEKTPAGVLTIFENRSGAGVSFFRKGRSRSGAESVF